MRIGSLFAGVGGLELGLEWAGIGHTVWQVENDDFCHRVLIKRFPYASRYRDVRFVGGPIWKSSALAPVDLICGGFPCQDISSAGKGAGLAGSRSGLWFEFRRIVSEMRPEWVVIENVASGGNRWVDAITGQLGELGYGSIPFPLSAFDVGAPHLRKRIFIVAHAYRVDGGKGRQRGAGSCAESRRPETSARVAADATRFSPRSDSGPQRIAAPPDTIRESIREQQGRGSGEGRQGETEFADDGGTRIASDRDRDRESTLAGDGSQVARLQEHRSDSSTWPALPELRRVDDGLPNRLDRHRALGNAVVPQCAEVIGHVIRELKHGQ